MDLVGDGGGGVFFEVLLRAQVCSARCAQHVRPRATKETYGRLFKWSSMLGDGDDQVPVATNKPSGRTSKDSKVPSAASKRRAAWMRGCRLCAGQ